MDNAFFPDRTLSIIPGLRPHEIQAVMQAYKSNIAITSRCEYTIVSETTTNARDDLSTHSIAPSSPSQRYVNAHWPI
ncbi:hypothetical protein PMIN03_012855 [Paraphaeosphaeria minitans]